MADRIKIPDYQGRKTFDFILEQLEDCITDIRPFFYNIPNLTQQKLYNLTFLEKCKPIVRERPKVDFIQLAMCDIAYTIVFIGVSSFDLSALIRLYLNKYNPVFIHNLLYYISFKPHPNSDFEQNWEEFKKENLHVILNNLSKYFEQEFDNTKIVVTSFPNIIEKFIDSKLNQTPYFRYYGGHQFKLGHYYRHLYQTVKYIDSQEKLCYAEKYEYIKTVRAQLSTPEQYLLFFNTISLLGRAWEFDQIEKKPEINNFNLYLITKYNLIKNVPNTYFMNSIEMKSYYPLVHFEFEDITKERNALEKRFK